VIKAASEKDKLKGTVIVMDDGDGLAKICSFSAKRTSMEPPPVTYC
jgi:hypothetical protein